MASYPGTDLYDVNTSLPEDTEQVNQLADSLLEIRKTTRASFGNSSGASEHSVASIIQDGQHIIPSGTSAARPSATNTRSGNLDGRFYLMNDTSEPTLANGDRLIVPQIVASGAWTSIELGEYTWMSGGSLNTPISFTAGYTGTTTPTSTGISYGASESTSWQTRARFHKNGTNWNQQIRFRLVFTNLDSSSPTYSIKTKIGATTIDSTSAALTGSNQVVMLPASGFTTIDAASISDGWNTLSITTTNSSSPTANRIYLVSVSYQVKRVLS